MEEHKHIKDDDSESVVHHKEHTEHQVHHQAPKTKIKRVVIWQAISLILLIALIASIWTGGFKGTSGTNTGNTTTASGTGLKAILLNDARCKECDTTNLVTQLKAAFPNLELKALDYSSKEGKEIFTKSGIKMLPAVLFSDDVKTAATYSQIEKFLDKQGDYLSLRIGASFDPNAEICDNGVDDNGDKNVDCADESCKSNWKCMEKKDKPVVELFVMSHCPYGTQIEKGIIPVADLLKDKIDFSVKFCDYSMHGENEIKEELQQYCIEKEQKSKHLKYLQCFLNNSDSTGCLTVAGIDKTMLDACVKAADTQFKVTANFNDKSTYKGNYPTFDIFAADNAKYGVQGSPTLIINGVQAESGRDSASLLNAVCTGFNVKPNECTETLSTVSPSPGFGYSTAGDAAAGSASCGV
jgi:hypothetical protein